MDVFVARQPIFDRDQKVYGYELLYRSGTENYFQELDGDKASLEVIRNSLSVIGIEKLTSRKKFFINFTRNLLLNQTAHLLPKEFAVVEILEDVKIDQPLVQACRKLKHQGYILALDDFVLQGNENNQLLDLAEIIKVDFRAAGDRERETIVNRIGRERQVKFLAEKTETQEEFDNAVQMGYQYFQGYFFSKPVIISRKDIPGYKINYLRILSELNKPGSDFEVVRQVIQRDPSLTYKLLQYINSAYFRFQREISSIKQALVLLGEKEVRKWASLTIMVHLAKDKPEEVLRVALLRARLCEELGVKAGMKQQGSELFLMGMFSLMDVLLGRSLEEILEDIPLSETVKKALSGCPNRYKAIFDLAVGYERGNWERSIDSAAAAGVDAEAIPAVYAAAIQWADVISEL